MHYGDNFTGSFAGLRPIHSTTLLVLTDPLFSSSDVPHKNPPSCKPKTRVSDAELSTFPGVHCSLFHTVPRTQLRGTGRVAIEHPWTRHKFRAYSVLCTYGTAHRIQERRQACCQAIRPSKPSFAVLHRESSESCVCLASIARSLCGPSSLGNRDSYEVRSTP